MASRNISDCSQPLHDAYNKACAVWAESSIPFVTCSYRSREEQQTTFNQGRTAPGKIVTWALPGQSAHNYLPSLAFDIAFKKPDGSLDWDNSLFEKFWQLIQKQSDQIEWGGNFPKGKKDFPHFEMKNWPTLIPKA